MAQTATKRPMTEHAQAAAVIRRTLKAAYPYTTFRVRSKSFSMGNDVRVDWIDGPTTAQVDRRIGQHEMGHFDGMIDLYEYSNVRDDIPQAKYVMTHRGYSPATLAALVAQINRRWGWQLAIDPRTGWIDPATDGPRGNNSGYQSEEIWRTFSPLSLVCPNGAHPTDVGDAFCGECGTKLDHDT